MTTIEIRTAAQVFEELNNTDEKQEPEKFCRLYDEWKLLLAELTN